MQTYLCLIYTDVYFFVTGNPPPQFKWLKDGVPITELSTDPFYKIISAKLEDKGSYRCLATNKIGSILSEEIKVIVACMYLNFKINFHFCNVEKTYLRRLC